MGDIYRVLLHQGNLVSILVNLIRRQIRNHILGILVVTAQSKIMGEVCPSFVYTTTDQSGPYINKSSLLINSFEISKLCCVSETYSVWSSIHTNSSEITKWYCVSVNSVLHRFLPRPHVLFVISFQRLRNQQ